MSIATLVTAISAEASGMSGWLLMGLPGAIYLGGAENIWIAIGIFIGTVLNWVLVAGRLRLYTHKTNAITLPRFLEERFGDPTGLLRSLSAVVILFFLRSTHPAASSRRVSCSSRRLARRTGQVPRCWELSPRWRGAWAISGSRTFSCDS